jgi:rhamnulose-1-phosphate aldolase
MQLNKTNENVRLIAAQIADVAQQLCDKGWAEATAGNISVNVTEHYTGINMDFRTYPMILLNNPLASLKGNYILITTKGSRMRMLAKDPAPCLSLVKISENGTGYQVLFEDRENPDIPSSELPAHLAIHDLLRRTESEDKAILHTHAHELIALSHMKELQDQDSLNGILLRMHTETAFFLPDGIGYIPFQVPGSEKLASASLKKLENHKVILWEKHGCLAVGKDIQTALDRLDLIAKAASVYLLCRQSGFVPEGLTDHQIALLLKSAGL